MYDIDYIAVPVDGSRASHAALELARQLATPDTVVAPFHAVEPWPAYMQEVLFPYAQLGEDAVEFEHELLNAAATHISAAHKLEPDDLTVVWGRAPATVVAHIAQTPAQLTVLGATGEGDKVPGLLGRVAQRVLHSSAQPVWLVTGQQPQKPSKFLVAVDLTDASSRLFEVAARLALRLGAEVEAIHVIPDPHAADHTQLLATTLPNDPAKLAKQLRDRVEAHFDGVYRDVEVAFGDASQVAPMMKRRRVVVGDPPTAIAAHADAIGADVIVVGNHGHRGHAGLGRVARAVVQRAPSHVVVVPTIPAARTIDD